MADNMPSVYTLKDLRREGVQAAREVKRDHTFKTCRFLDCELEVWRGGEVRLKVSCIGHKGAGFASEIWVVYVAI